MEPNALLSVVLNSELGECGARMWNCMAFNRRSTSRKMEDAAFIMFPSVCLERENIHRIATRDSPCADVIAVQLARMSNQILQDQGNVPLKTYDNLQSAWKHK